MAQKYIKRKSLTKGKKSSSIGLNAIVQKVSDKVKSAASELEAFQPGDTVRVHVRIQEGDKKRIQAFEGTCIAKRKRAEGLSFTVRKISHGVGVERVFLANTPKVAKVERIVPGQVRRAKLYYLRALEGRAAKIDRELGRKQEDTSPKTTA